MEKIISTIIGWFRRKPKTPKYPYVDIQQLHEYGGYKIVDLNKGYQYRINDRIDLYPVNGRFHDIKKNERGQYGDAFDFVTHFNFNS